jgi:hypothetical protein
MNTKFYFILLLTLPIFTYGQGLHKIKKKGKYIYLVNKQGKYLDTLITFPKSYKNFYPFAEKIFVMDYLAPMNCSSDIIIQEFSVEGDKFVLKNNILLKRCECLSVEDTRKFKVKIKKRKIIWKFRRGKKKYKGEFIPKGLEELQFIELPKSVCCEDPSDLYFY